jgi:hypothetical protein
VRKPLYRDPSEGGFGAGKMDDERGLMFDGENRNLDCAKFANELRDKPEMIRITWAID